MEGVDESSAMQTSESNAMRAIGFMRGTDGPCADCIAPLRLDPAPEADTRAPMDIRWIQDFVTLAEVRNFTRASEIRNLSQAAFSRRIQALEHWLGATLIDRTTFPLKLTEAGEQLRGNAAGLLGQIADLRSQIAGEPSRNHVRIALPYALACSRLPGWWCAWAPDASISCSLEVGNVHDTISAFAAGSVDLLICYHHAAHPVSLDANKYERHVLGEEAVRPYAARSLIGSHAAALPGTATQPVPLLMYSPSVYFARVVDSVVDAAPRRLWGFRRFEAAMSDVLGDLAQQGLGLAWLPESSFLNGRLSGLQAVGQGEWDCAVSIVAYRAKTGGRKAVDQVWERMTSEGANGQR